MQGLKDSEDLDRKNNQIYADSLLNQEQKNRLLEAKNNDVYISSSRLTGQALADIEAERAARVNALKSSLDNDTMVY